MRNIFIITTLISLLCFPTWGEKLNWEDLVERNGLFYKKFTTVPYTGEVLRKFLLLKFEMTYKGGKLHGPYSMYDKNGNLSKRGKYKEGEMNGLWKSFKNGQELGNSYYENGKKVGRWVGFYDNGQLHYQVNYKDGKKHGLWEEFNKDGSIKLTEIYKDGVKQE